VDAPVAPPGVWPDSVENTMDLDRRLLDCALCPSPFLGSIAVFGNTQRVPHVVH
jgi:hypothetical protein